MGVVYAATHTRTRKAVAIKVLRPAMSEDAPTRQRFLREARAACAVHHANVVEIHDVIELDDGTPVMVMELLEGESLATRLQRERVVPVGDLARLMLPVVSAVGTAHQVGIVHRDLKPDNIFLDRRRGAIDVRVLDFGIAKLTATEGDAASSAAITGTGAVLGTPYYMSPEQVFGEKDIDHRADIWALGVILYECLAGARPTQADNIGQVFKIVMTDAIKPIQTLVPDLPKPLVDLIGRMLSREREKRPKDLREVAAVLAEYIGATAPAFGEPVAAVVRVSTPGEGFEDTLEEPAKRDGRASTQSPITVPNQGESRRRRPVILVASAAILLVAGVGGAMWMRGSTQPATPTRTGEPTVSAPPVALPAPEPSRDPSAMVTASAPVPQPSASSVSTVVASTAPPPVVARPSPGKPAVDHKPSTPAPTSTQAASAAPVVTAPPTPTAAPAATPKPTVDPASYQ